MAVSGIRYEGFCDLLSHMGRKRPSAVALLCGEGPAGPKTVTWSELADAVRARAGELRAEGNTSEAIFCDGSLDCVIEVFAAVMAGLQVVLLDATLPLAAVGDLAAAGDADCAFGDDAHLAAVAGRLGAGVKDGTGRILFFTSGTTSRAKAVVLTDASLMASAYNGSCLLPLGEDDVLLCLLPLAHVFGFVCGLLWGLSCGAAVALGRGRRHYLDDCAHFGPTALSVVPSLLGFLLRADALNPELRLLLVGASECPDALLAAAQARGIQVACGYGLTETSSGVALSPAGDASAMAVCPDDRITIAEDGEVLIEAPTCMMQGYYKQPEATAEVLVDGMLHSGDLGRLDAEGRLAITGRKKEVLALPGGDKLFLPEYEAALAQALGTTELAVVLRDGRPALVLEEVPAGETGTLDAIAGVLAAMPMGQRIASVVELGHPLPRTASGKVQRWKLTEELEATWSRARKS